MKKTKKVTKAARRPRKLPEVLPKLGKQPQLVFLNVNQIREKEGDNANVMSPTQFELLVNAIKKLGFLQAVTVRERADGFELIDGHHRFKAAKQAGLVRIPALITEANDPTAMAEALSLNRLRGDVDLGKATAILADLKAVGFDDLTLTGFGASEIEALLKDMGGIPSDLADLGVGENTVITDDLQPGDAAPPRRHRLNLSFDRESDRDMVRELAMGEAATVEAGLVLICRRLMERAGWPDDQEDSDGNEQTT